MGPLPCPCSSGVHAGGSREGLSPSLELSVPEGFYSNMCSSPSAQRQTPPLGGPVVSVPPPSEGIRGQPGHFTTSNLSRRQVISHFLLSLKTILPAPTWLNGVSQTITVVVVVVGTFLASLGGPAPISTFTPPPWPRFAPLCLCPPQSMQAPSCHQHQGGQIASFRDTLPDLSL